MSICTLNGSEHEAGSGLETWGQLLAVLEQGDGPGRPVVTAVRFAGVDQPTFREPEILALGLSEAAPVVVEASAVGELVASARDAMLNGVETLTAVAQETAHAFRLHDLPRANAGLIDFVTTFRLVTMLTSAMTSPDGPAAVDELNVQDKDLLEQLRVSLEALLAFNQNEDWISVADILEYEIAETLPRWGTILKQGRENGS
jgi:hypothetical protein